MVRMSHMKLLLLQFIHQGGKLEEELTPRKEGSATPARGTTNKAAADPSSPATNTRSRKQLQLE
jgi:hypothetical protein